MAISTTVLDVRPEHFPTEPQTQEWLESIKKIRALAGRVVVEMLPPLQPKGVIHLPDESIRNVRPDIGWVISVGPGVPGLYVGDCVVVRPSDGTWRSNVRWGDYQAEQVRTYGVFVPHDKPGKPRVYDALDSIIGYWSFKHKMLKATGATVIIERAVPEEKTTGGLFLTDKQTKRSGEAKVISCGPQCHDVQEGELVLYNPRAINHQIDLSSYGKHYAALNENGIEAVLDPKCLVGSFASESAELQTV